MCPRCRVESRGKGKFVVFEVGNKEILVLEEQQEGMIIVSRGRDSSERRPSRVNKGEYRDGQRVNVEELFLAVEWFR